MYIYIYIYVYVCVCVCVSVTDKSTSPLKGFEPQTLSLSVQVFYQLS